jgi:hypothetical protein
MSAPKQPRSGKKSRVATRKARVVPSVESFGNVPVLTNERISELRQGLASLKNDRQASVLEACLSELQDWRRKYGVSAAGLQIERDARLEGARTQIFTAQSVVMLAAEALRGDDHANMRYALKGAGEMPDDAAEGLELLESGLDGAP